VTVAAGATTATFSITTRAVGGTFLITITGSFGGQTRTANLAVDPLAAPPLAAVFSVVAKSSGALNSCSMSVGGGSLECTFDGRASTGSNLSQYLWTYTLPGQQLSASGALVDTPAAGCGFFSGVTTKNSGNPFQMIVTLRVVDGSGNSSAPVTNQNVMVTPLNNTCGFSF